MGNYQNTYILRDIPPDLWVRAKHRTLDDGVSLRVLILRAVTAYLAQERRSEDNDN